MRNCTVRVSVSIPRVGWRVLVSEAYMPACSFFCHTLEIEREESMHWESMHRARGSMGTWVPACPSQQTIQRLYGD